MKQLPGTYYSRNKEKMLANQKAYQQAHAEKVKARARAYYLKNKERIRLRDLERSAQLRQAKAKMYYPRNASLERRISLRIVQNGECRECHGCADPNGYARIFIDRKPISVHRLVWSLANGPIPDGMHVLHACDNRSCIRTSHLFLGTNYDNVKDKVRKNRQSRIDWEGHHHAKLNREKAETIRIQWASGRFTRRQLAEQYGVSPGLVGHVVKGRLWKEKHPQAKPPKSIPMAVHQYAV